MAIKGWTGHNALTTCIVIAAIGISGLAPGIADAESHTRTAPYDFGERCSRANSVGTCNDDSSAMLTGAISSVFSHTCIPANTGCRTIQSSSLVGIFVDIDEPGTLRITVDAEGSNTSSVCVGTAPETATYRHFSACGDDPENTVSGLGVGRWRVFVGLWSASNAIVIVRNITYEFTTT